MFSPKCFGRLINGMKYEQCENGASVITLCMLLTSTAVGQVVGSTRTCHAAGPGSIPGRDKFPGRGFFGVFPYLYDKCQEALGPKVPEYHLAIHNHSLRAPMT